ncbi:hypothetical protein BFL36_08315 [Clavibacter michiganensis]|uniref:DUF2834 domain-containing protein n=1 Tax=Clavibacter michiganensis TaxID=28447 RepID=A0A251YFF2_9MICO|nr:DUF2834 domain-containing protein [Clavibacter michiganensis]OUE22975.1 hypothetical protein BFL36_08315 [Clavibacter michiganensis]
MSRPRILPVAYFALAAVGLVATWWFNLRYRGDDYVADWFANPASSSAAVDIIVVFAVTVPFYVVEGRRVGLPTWFTVLLVPVSLVGAVAFALPLFLGVRELRLTRRRRDPAGGRPSGTAAE